MVNWLLKIFTSIASIKTAFIALLSVLTLVILWKWGNETIKHYGFKPIYSEYLFIIAAYAASHIFVEAIYSIVIFFKKISIKIKNYIHQENQVKILKAKVKSSFPLLPKDQRDILIDLISSGRIVTITKKSPFVYLKEEKYIDIIQRVSADSYLIELNSNIKGIVNKYAKEERGNFVGISILSLTDEEKEFLKIFFSNHIPFGTPQNGVYMKADIFLAGKNLARKNLVAMNENSSKSIVKFTLHVDAAKKLGRVVFKNRYKRLEVDIDLHFVSDGYLGGSGVPF
ncbi:MAG: hypothetical protein ACTFAL_09025 [Candidatus Electronema sp. V4]|uniref:hypothetical protein n=1 Tax=Candidatus Electronema sp. V4 TaxID=3454756 RepID=UPI0040559A54